MSNNRDNADHEETHFTYKKFLLGYWKPSVFYTGENKIPYTYKGLVCELRKHRREKAVRK